MIVHEPEAAPKARVINNLRLRLKLDRSIYVFRFITQMPGWPTPVADSKARRNRWCWIPGVLPLIARRIVRICYLRVKATLRFAPALLGLDPEATDPRSLLGMAMRGRNGDDSFVPSLARVGRHVFVNALQPVVGD
jgi:hypothetical protein